MIASGEKKEEYRDINPYWATDEQNFLLDIKNVLTDTDFKIYSPANSIRAKVEWKKSIEYEFDTLKTNLGWELFSRKHHGGSYYG